MAGNVAATVAAMREKIRPELPILYPLDARLWGKIKNKTDVEVVSYRPTRVPLELLAGTKGRTANPDGGDLGLGSAPYLDFMTLVPFYIFQAGQFTKAAEINTNSKEKAIENYARLTVERGMKMINKSIEALLNSDGSNTLDSVVSVSGNILTVNNANQFYDNQDIDIWSALGGTLRGTVTILSVDAPNNQIYLTAAPPAGTAASDLLLYNGSAGIAGVGLYGIEYWQVNSNAGNLANLSRAAYPGKLSTPTVNFNNAALTPGKARLMLAQMQSAMGWEAADESNLVWHMNTDMEAAWENVGINVARIIQTDLKGSTSEDMLKKSPPSTLAGRPIFGSINAKPGRIDGLALKHWFRVENQPIDYYEENGQTEFQMYGASGGLQASTIFYLWTGTQVGVENVRAGVFGSNIAIPAGYFGH